jgi:antitoxin component YwqK of YwqJK toxin-antitoxin module
LNGLATRYYSNGNVRNVGFYFNGKMVGPIYYFNKNKKLVSYNERDFENVVIYVKKYDSLGNLLSESGAPFSQYLKIVNPRKIIYFIFTEPEGYSNKLNVYINDCPTNVYYNNASKNHVAFIKFPNYLLNSISIKKLTIKSKLFSKAGNLLMENEINYAIKDSLNIISLIVK